jgi:MFS family permease
VLATLMGVVNAFDVPARQSFLVEMVGREDLMNAIAINSSMFNSARVIGPSIAGILVASIGEGWCFFANAVSYIAVIAGLLMMRVGRSKIEKRDVSPFEHMAEGFRYVFRTGPIRALLTLTALVSVFALPYSVLMPIFAARVLHGNARTLGVLMGATGIGALMGTLTLASRTRLQGLARLVAICCAGFGTSLILFRYHARIRFP